MGCVGSEIMTDTDGIWSNWTY